MEMKILSEAGTERLQSGVDSLYTISDFSDSQESNRRMP